MLRTLPSTSPSPVAECAQLRGANHSSLGFTRQPAIARAVWGTCRGSKGRRAVGASRSERGGKRRRSCRGKMKRSFSKARVRTIPSELVPVSVILLEVGFTRAGALPASPCHFRVQRRTDDARSGRTSLSGVSESSCAQRSVCALGGDSRFFAHSSLGLEALRAGRDLWDASRVPRYTTFIVSQSGKRPHAAAR